MCIGLIEEPIDEASAALLLDSSLLRFLLFEELVIYFSTLRPPSVTNGGKVAI